MADVLDRLVVDFAKGGASGRAGIFDDEENASKLLWAEYGTRSSSDGEDEDEDEKGGSEPRPTITPAYNEDDVYDDIARGVDRVLSGSGSAVMAVDAAVKILSEDIVKNIVSNTPPELATSTIDARRSRGNPSTVTLVDSGKMRDAVRSEAKPGDDGWGD